MKVGKAIGPTAALAAGVFMAGGVQAEPLTVAYIVPPTHVYVTQGIKPWMECVGAATNGEVTFQEFPSGQITGPKDSIHALQNGIAHITQVVPAYESDKIPLNNMPTLPGIAESAVQVTSAFQKAIERNTPMAEELTALGIRPFLTQFSAPYQLMSTTGPVDTMDKMKGLKVRGGAGPINLALDALGATPVEMATADLYVGMQRGTVDATVLAMTAAPAYKLQELVKSISTNGAFSFAETIWSLDEKTYQAMPEAHQKAVMDCGLKIQQSAAEFLDKDAARVIEEFKALNIEFYEFPPEMLEQVNAALAPIADKFVADLDSRGLPGRAAYDAFVQAVADSK